MRSVDGDTPVIMNSLRVIMLYGRSHIVLAVDCDFFLAHGVVHRHLVVALALMRIRL